MRTTKMLLSVLVSLFCNASYAEDSSAVSDSPKYLKIGASWDLADDYDGTTLELQSPAVIYQGKATNEFSLVGTLSNIRHRNVVVDDDNGKYKSVYSSTASVGVNWRVSSPRYPFASYLQAGAVQLIPEKKLAQFDHPSWGARVALGIEFPFREENGITSAFFLQETLVSGLGRANQLSREPDLFNSQILSFGARLSI